MQDTLEKYSLYNRTHTSIQGTRPGGGSIGWCQSYRVASCPIPIGLTKLGSEVSYTEDAIRTAFSDLPVTITLHDEILTLDDEMKRQYVPGLKVTCNISPDVLLAEMDPSMKVADTVYERTEHGGLIFVKTKN